MKVNYPTGVENHGGFLRIWFMYQGQRVREGLGVTDTPKNRKAAGELRASVAYSIKVGAFDYAKQFPSSSNLNRFGLARQELTVGELAEKWLAIKKLKYRKILMALIPLALKPPSPCLGSAGWFPGSGRRQCRR